MAKQEMTDWISIKTRYARRCYMDEDMYYSDVWKYIDIFKPYSPRDSYIEIMINKNHKDAQDFIVWLSLQELKGE